jgi:O-antigen ligase
MYTALLCITAAGMPNLNLAMSMGGILLAALWLHSPGPVAGFKSLVQNKPALLLVGLFAMHIAWLVNTTDFAYAAKDIRIKLPLLLFPVVLGSVAITRRQIAFALLALAAGVTIAMAHGMWYYLFTEVHFSDYRSLVRGISHIRFSLMATLVYAATWHYFPAMSPWLKALSVVFVLAVATFFNLIQSATGAGMLLLVTSFYIYHWVKNLPYGRAVYAAVCAAMVASLSFGVSRYYKRYFTPMAELHQGGKLSQNGCAYEQLAPGGMVENGMYVHAYLCPSELLQAWNARSSHPINPDAPYDSPTYGALLRYLTSLHLTKDAAGVAALSAEDVQRIENEVPSVLYTSLGGLRMRLHELLTSYHFYTTSGYVSGTSFFQRVAYWKAAGEIIRAHFWTGTGTGDVKQAFESLYAQNSYNLAPQYRNRAHNQFLTFFISFGVLGLLYFIAVVMAPLVWHAKPPLLLGAFCLIAFTGCLTEDTLETQAGVTFFAFFYSLLWHLKPNCGEI